MAKRIFISVLLIFVGLIGTLLRFINLSPFKVYPDSFESLLVAENINHFHSVVGTLGNNGLVFPEYFMWTRPVYPLLINIFNIFVHNSSASAQIISFFAGILAIPISFFFLKSIFNKFKIALSGVLLISLSFYHSVWGGFIMTETTGVLCMLLFLLNLFTGLTKKNIFLDIATGVLFVIAVFTRYEYAIIAFPAIFLILFHRHPEASAEGSHSINSDSSTSFHFAQNDTIIKLLTIGASFLLTSVIFITQLFPLQSLVSVITSQLHDFIVIAGILVLMLVVIVILRHQTKNLFLKIIIHKLRFFPQGTFHFEERTLFRMTLIMFTCILILGIICIPFLRSFLFHEPLISFCTIVGFVYMLLKKELKILAVFSFISCVLLVIVYQKINPQMDRYMTHLLPFLLIPASVGLVKIMQSFFVILREYPLVSPKDLLKTDRKILRRSLRMTGVVILLSLISYLLFLQLITAFNGLRYLQDSSWYQVSYEEKSAEKLKKFIPGCHVIASEAKQSRTNGIAASTSSPRNDEECVLLVSRPEPYFYFLQLPTQSIADVYPYVYFKAQSDSDILIVNDMGMADIFPKFSSFLSNNMPKNSIVASYSVGEPYHSTNIIKKENAPVVVYKIKYSQLEELINKQTH